MSTSFKYNTYSNIRLSDNCGNSATNAQNIFDLFKNTNTELFTRAKPSKKEGSKKGWLNSLMTPEEAQYIGEQRSWNVGIKCGQKVGEGYTVVFDKEYGGILPEETQDLLSSHAVAIWTSPHGGTNYLTIVSKEALNELQKYKEKVYITGEDHDLEILKSKHALIPPSSINHSDCRETKPCDGEGTGEYELQSVSYNETIDLRTVQRILDTLPVEEQNSSTYNTNSEGRNSTEEVDLTELSEDFEPNSYFKENIPGNDSFHERIDTMLKVPEIRRLWNGDYEDRSMNELKLRSYVAFYFNADRKMVQYIFEELLPPLRNEPLKYQGNKNHAKDVLNIEISRPYYTTAISFNLRDQLAREIIKNETVTVNKLHGSLLRTDKAKQYDKRTIQRGLRIFNQLGVIERTSDNTYRNKEIDSRYIEKLEELNEEYKPTNIEDHYE